MDFDVIIGADLVSVLLGPECGSLRVAGRGQKGVQELDVRKIHLAQIIDQNPAMTLRLGDRRDVSLRTVGGHGIGDRLGERLDGRPVLTRDAEIDAVTDAPTRHHHMVTKRPFLNCPNTRERLA